MEGKKEAGEEVISVISTAQGALAETGEAVQQAAGQAWSRASGVADDVLAAGRRAARSAATRS